MQIVDEQSWWDAAEHVASSEDTMAWLGGYISPSRLKHACDKQDHKTVVSLLNHAWFRLPDVPQIHALHNFHLVCELCSEYDSAFGELS